MPRRIDGEKAAVFARTVAPVAGLGVCLACGDGDPSGGSASDWAGSGQMMVPGNANASNIQGVQLLLDGTVAQTWGAGGGSSSQAIVHTRSIPCGPLDLSLATGDQVARAFTLP